MMAHDTEDILAALAILFILGGCGLAVHYENENNKLKTAECHAKYQGLPHTEELPFATSKSGCKIVKIVSYDKDCNYQTFVYSTDCKAVSWEVYQNKRVYHYSNVNGDSQ
jgi:hypothetical protein